ncbi:LeuA family protein [Halosegnis longus]|uniref:Citramalate synthase n=1 Tax=Halosegnis longus TaxID=2216012 RepID=A0AAJ4RAE7_9EURY|nr:LeuA family protein [Halosegnis longus]RNJ27284.1 citramalate synthase [Salella cibi]
MTGLKDVTLREGAQMPGLDIGDEQGRAVIEALASLGLGRVELSFPRATPRESWYRAAERHGLETAALARSIPADVEAALAVEPDEIEIIITTSELQLEHALGKSRQAAETMMRDAVELAVDGGVRAGVTLMDAVRADGDVLDSYAETAVEAGASHVTVADTTGAGDPSSVAETVRGVVETVGSEAGVTIHPHDDMDVGAANAKAGVEAGADSVDATVGGLGERAGNAPLEAVAVLLAEHGEPFDIDHAKLTPVCRRVHELLDVPLDPTTPVIGEAVHRHESGLHTAAMLSDPAAYEGFDPTRYGADRHLLFGRGTGSGAVRTLLTDAGIEPTEDRVTRALTVIHETATDRGEPLSEQEARDIVRERVE